MMIRMGMSKKGKMTVFTRSKIDFVSPMLNINLIKNNTFFLYNSKFKFRLTFTVNY